MTGIPFLINIVLSLFVCAAGYYAWNKSKTQKNYLVVSIILMLTGAGFLLVNGIAAIVELS